MTESTPFLLRGDLSPFLFGRRRGGGSGGPITFGALTPVGQGAASISGVADGTYGEFTVASGMISPNTSPLTVGAATVGSYTIDVTASARHVASETELQTALHGAGKASTGQTIYLRNKESVYELKTLPWASTWDEHPSGIIIQGDDPSSRPSIDYWDLSRAVISDVTFRDIEFRMQDYPARGPIDAALSAATWAIIRTDGAAGISGLMVEDCLFDGGLVPFAEGGRFTAQNPPFYVRGDSISDLTFRRNVVQNVSECLIIGIDGFVVEDNLFRRYHNDGIVLQNASNSDCDNGIVRNNHFQEQSGWGGTFHADLIQFQPINAATRIGAIEIAGNTSSIGAVPKPAQTDAVSNPGSVSYNATRALDATDHGRTIVVNGTFTATLPSAAASTGQQFCMKCTGGTVTVALSVPDTWEGGTAPVLVNGNYASFVSDGSSEWKLLPAGLWSQHVPVLTDRTLGALQANRVAYVDATAGDVTVTLPENGSQTFTIFRADYSANNVTVTTAGGDTLSINGQSGDIDMVPGYGFVVVGNGAGAWTATESTPTTQGIFGNVHPQGLYEDVRIHGNIIYVSTVHGIHLEQNVSGLHSWNNTILRPAWDDANGDGVLGQFEAETGTGYGAIWVNGTDAWSFRDLAVGPLNDGAALGSVFLNAGSTTAALAALGPYLDGTARTNQRPVTRAEVIAAATGPAAASFLGAVGYYDFDAGAPTANLPDPTVTATTPAVGADLSASTPILLTFDHYVKAGAGTITVWNETADEAVEAFNVATGAGDGGGTIAFTANTATIAGGSAWPGGATLSVRIAAGTIVSSIYETTVAAVADDTFSWPTVADVNVTPQFVMAQGLVAFNSSKTFAGITFPEGRAILMIGWRSSTNHAAPTVTVGGQAATIYGDVYYSSSQMHLAVFERVVTAGAADVVVAFGAQQYDVELAVYGIGGAEIQSSHDYIGPSSPTPYKVEHTVPVSQGNGAIGMAYTQIGRGANAFAVVSGWDQIDAQPTTDTDFTAYMSGAVMSAGALTANPAAVFRVDWDGAHQSRIGKMVVVG